MSTKNVSKTENKYTHSHTHNHSHKKKKVSVKTIIIGVVVILLIGVIIWALPTPTQHKQTKTMSDVEKIKATTYINYGDEVSDNYTPEEIEAAGDFAIAQFSKYRDCKLSKLTFYGELDNYKGYDHVIVYSGAFLVGEDAWIDGFSPDTKQDDWRWYISKDKDKNWVEVAHGPA